MILSQNKRALVLPKHRTAQYQTETVLTGFADKYRTLSTRTIALLAVALVVLCVSVFAMAQLYIKINTDEVVSVAKQAVARIPEGAISGVTRALSTIQHS